MKKPQKVMLFLIAAITLLSASCGNPWLREALNKSDDDPAVQSVPTTEVPNALILRIKAGSDKTFAIPTNNPWPYDWCIDWGDGTPEEPFAGIGAANTGISHTFPDVGEYDIAIRAESHRGHAAFGFGYGTIGANASANKEKVLKALGHIKENISVAEFPNAWAWCFSGCINLNEVSATLLPAVPNGTITIFAAMFSYCSSLESLPAGFKLPNVPKGTSGIFSSMFAFCSSLESLPAGFKLPAVPNGTSAIFSGMFADCSSLECLPAGFTLPDVPNGTSYIFYQMFYGCSSLKSLPDGFKLPNVPKGTSGIFSSMFAYCSSLESLPDGFKLPAVPNGTSDNFSWMFSDCINLDANINDLITGPIMDETKLNNSFWNMHSTFYNCSKLTGSAEIAIEFGFGWGAVPSDDRNTFYNCTSLNDYGSIHANWK
jgi:hypothetical protein